MRFSTTFGKLALLLPILSATPTLAEEEQALEQWIAEAGLKFFPNHTSWDTSFDEYFSKDLKATFNLVSYDFDSLRAFFSGLAAAIPTAYDSLVIELVDVVALPEPEGLGGNVYLTGRETGVTKNGTSRTEKDASFGVVKEEGGVRKIVEWRESTNFA